MVGNGKAKSFLKGSPSQGKVSHAQTSRTFPGIVFYCCTLSHEKDCTTSSAGHSRTLCQCILHWVRACGHQSCCATVPSISPPSHPPSRSSPVRIRVSEFSICPARRRHEEVQLGCFQITTECVFLSSCLCLFLCPCLLCSLLRRVHTASTLRIDAILWGPPGMCCPCPSIRPSETSRKSLPRVCS